MIGERFRISRVMNKRGKTMRLVSDNSESESRMFFSGRRVLTGFCFFMSVGIRAAARKIAGVRYHISEKEGIIRISLIAVITTIKLTAVSA